MPPERLELPTHGLQISCSTSYDWLFLATLISAYHRFRHKLNDFGLPFGLPLPRMGHRRYSRSMFSECAADGVFESNFKSHTEPVLLTDKELQNR